MTLESAVQRIFWRLGNGQFTPNQKDIDSMKEIAEWINRQKQIDLDNNKLFAKIYVYCFMHEIQFYKDINFAQKKMHELLNQDIEEHYDLFSKRLNELKLDLYKKSIGLSIKHPQLLSDEEKIKDQHIIKANGNELSKYFIGIYSEDKIYKSLNNQITEAINNYRNHDRDTRRKIEPEK